jgi:8-oxo-dGTP diphosphatase
MAGKEPDLAVGPDIVAAGALVTRNGQVLLVHRPKYDDWSFPKGKQDPGEHVTGTAVREVLEETGVEIRLGRPLLPQLYAVAGGRAKLVHYWVGHVIGDDDLSQYQVNHEIDALGWFDFDVAVKTLSYLDDVALLEQFLKIRKRTSALVILRHARARARKRWEGEDTVRPLTRVGATQAREIDPPLMSYGVTRVVSSDSLRCLQTIRPYAREHVLQIQAEPGLSEERFTRHTVAKVLDGLLASRESAVLCTHRPVLPVVFDLLGFTEEPLEPGEMVVVHHRKQRIVAVERHLVR